MATGIRTENGEVTMFNMTTCVRCGGLLVREYCEDLRDYILDKSASTLSVASSAGTSLIL